MVQKNIFNSKPDLPETYDNLNLADIYEGLPEFYKSLLKHHRDPQEVLIATFAVITTSAALIPNVFVHYGSKRSYPFLFLMLLLPPANGKSALSLSRNLLLEINKKLTKEYDEALKRFQHDSIIYKKGVKAGASGLPPTPPKLQQIILAGNATSARLILQLAENGENIPLVISETEIDVVSGMLSGEMGAQNSVILRQAFHNETTSSARKADKETLTAERPKLALLLSGTENQVSALFKGNEDGLLSRFLVLDLVGSMQWVSPRPRTGELPLENHYSDYANKFLKLWHQTQNLAIEVKFTDEQWDELDNKGKHLQKLAHLAGGAYAISLARRHVLMATRLCTIITFFRQIDPAACVVPHIAGALYPSETDFKISLELTAYSFQKALELFQRMPSSSPIKTNSTRQFNFFEALPSDFNMVEAVSVAQKLKIPTRTKDRWLSEFVQTGALEKLGRGLYKKSPVAVMAVAEKKENSTI
ncbi:DUF3987 domain-containing protein [Pontibacter beigongshangensis]|uniref:DUF3987 domain-containing protein n=1 Tax=Pontibacter beigongshangensis TaxID=2574733 RepID=UPI00164F71C6|nr:DUF3987 domain-containing protein [Pontibacter beigongshangensis]